MDNAQEVLEVESLNEQIVVEEEQLPTLKLEASIGAILFVSSKPVSVAKLAEITKATEQDVEAACEELKSRFVEELHGVILQEVAGGFQLRTSPGAAPIIRSMFPLKVRRLSRAAAETLAIIAYKQPVQRAEIEMIRGVDALPTLKTLLDAKLIRLIGREDTVGQPALYGTTPLFLERFGLNDLSELPTPRELSQLLSDPGEAADAADVSAEVSARSEAEGAELEEIVD